MLQRFQCSFARQAIQRPKQENIEPALARITEHMLEFRTVRMFARNLVNVFRNYMPSHSAREVTELHQLVVGFLLASGYSAIDRTSCHFGSPLRFFDHRDRAAFRARFERSAAVMPSAVFAPPCLPRHFGQYRTTTSSVSGCSAHRSAIMRSLYHC